MSQKRALAIHDISCIGRCSLTVALPILSAAGIETAALPTALLSTQTAGFEHYTYLDLSEQIPPIVRHWQDLGERFDAIYTGFLGSERQIDLIADVIDSFREAETFVLVDPVMADFGKLYPVYTDAMAKNMRRLCRRAGLIIPNLTEAAFLLDEPYLGETHTVTQIRELLQRLTDLGCPRALVTGARLRPGRLGAACYDAERDTFSYYDGAYLCNIFHGTGDVFGSSLLAGLLRGLPLEQAMAVAIDYTHVCLEYTVEEGRPTHYGPCFERATPYLLHRLGIE